VNEFPEALISVDTYKAVIAEEALQAGAHWVNDVWSLRADPKLRAVVAEAGCAVILMHNRSSPASVEVRAQLGSAYTGAEYTDLIEDVKRELLESVTLARKDGISDEHIILDPGIGFGKKVEHNLELINRLDEIRALGFPVLLGPSVNRSSVTLSTCPPTSALKAPPRRWRWGSCAGPILCGYTMWNIWLALQK